MKVKIDLAGWSSFNGKLGGVPFVNGVSARDVTEKEARKIGGNVRLIRLDNEAQVGTTTINVGDIPAAPVTITPRASEAAPTEKVEKGKVEEETKEDETPKVIYTKEQLETIADEKGIKGVREIANLYDVKGVQISQLISGILAAQGK